MILVIAEQQPLVPEGLFKRGQSYLAKLCTRGKSRSPYFRVYPHQSLTGERLPFGKYEALPVKEFRACFREKAHLGVTSRV